MFSHIMVGANDLKASKKFYDATFAALGYATGVMDEAKGRCAYRTDTGVFLFTLPLNKQPATGANGGTIGFSAKTEDAINAWYKAGVENGGTACEDPPGKRPNGMYLAYLRDPAGNKLCTVLRSN